MQDNTNLLLVGGFIIAAGVIIIVKFLSNKRTDKNSIKPAMPNARQQELQSNSTKIKENEIEIEKQISILSQLKMIENNLIEQIKDIKEKIAQLEKQKDSNLV